MLEANPFLDYAPDIVYSAVWGDYNQDAWVDLIMLCAFPGGGGPPGYSLGAANMVVFRNNCGRFAFSSAVPVDLGGGSLVPPDPFIYNLALGYVNGDHLLDAVFTDIDGFSGAVRVALNQGFDSTARDFVFADATSTWFGAGGSPTGVSSTRFADLDHDGKMDVVFACESLDDNLLCYRNTGSNYEELHLGVKPFDEDLADVTLSDLDLNGWMDILTVPDDSHNQVGKPRVLYNGLLAGGEFAEYADSGIPTGAISGALAFDWVGNKPSVFLGRAPAGTGMDVEDSFYAFKSSNDEVPGKYVRLRFVPDQSVTNGSGIGTRIAVPSNGDTLSQWIMCNRGRGSQDPRILVFPLADSDPDIINICVTWPDGNVKVFQNQPVLTEVPGLEGAETATIGLTDNRLFTVDSTSLEGSFQAGVQESWWIFEWDADYQTWPELDVWLESGPPGGCTCVAPGDTTTIDPDMPDVDVLVSQTATGLYHHEVTWKGWCCELNCQVGFTARSVLNGRTTIVGTGTAISPKRACPTNP